MWHFTIKTMTLYHLLMSLLISLCLLAMMKIIIISFIYLFYSYITFYPLRIDVLFIMSVTVKLQTTTRTMIYEGWSKAKQKIKNEWKKIDEISFFDTFIWKNYLRDYYILFANTIFILYKLLQVPGSFRCTTDMCSEWIVNWSCVNNIYIECIAQCKLILNK